jgi:hypothetical protein
MYVERNVFHLKFGLAKSALGQWKTFLEKAHFKNDDIHVRLLTDLTGPAYVIILELSYSSYAELEPSECLLTKDPDWKEFYQSFIPLCEKSERTLYKLAVSY